MIIIINVPILINGITETEREGNIYTEGICNKPKRINTSELDELVWNKFIETLSKSSSKRKLKMKF